MTTVTPAQRLARLTRRLAFGAFGIALVGVVLALAVRHTFFLNFGAVLVIGALLVGVLAVPIGFLVNALAMRDDWRALEKRGPNDREQAG